MSCRKFDEALVDAARGTLDAAGDAAVRRHAARCPSCAERLRRQLAVTGALLTLAASVRDEAPSEAVSARLMREFVSHEQQRRRPAARWWPAAAAAVFLSAGAVAGWLSTGRQAGESARPPGPAAPRQVQAPIAPGVEGPTAGADGASAAGVRSRPSKGHVDRRVAPGRGPATIRRSTIEFVAWPGASALPAFESGELVTTELPASVVPLLGLGASAEGRDRVTAQVIVAQDGLPRAVRLVR